MDSKLYANKQYSIHSCQLIDLTRIADSRGNLSIIEGGESVPFDIKRIYYLYDVPAGSCRAGHAHKELFQLLIAVSGSFDVHLDDGEQKRTVQLNRPFEGLVIPPMVWRLIDNFSSGAVCLSIASEHYDESDYYRQYEDFLSAKHRIK